MNVYEKHIMSEPRLPFIFHSYRYTPGWASGRNWHENLELLCFTEGSGTVTSNDLRISVKAGDVAVINPNCIHDIKAAENVHYYCLIIDRSFCLANHFDTNLLSFTPKVSSGKLYSIICDIATEFQNTEAPYRIQAIRSLVLAAMTLLLRDHSTATDKPEGDSRILSSVKLALGYISSEYRKPLTLDDIANAAGLSKYYLAREFRRITGKTPVGYLCEVRCEKAKSLLAEGNMSVTAVAHACGFSNLSYFTKTFKKATGVLPSEYAVGLK